MESPVVLDKPPEYHGNGSRDADKGFPFEDSPELGDRGDGWSELSARHPDIAARLRARPSAWGRKRRSPQHAERNDPEDLVSGLGEHFNRFPFDDIPSEFREHFPSHWSHRYAPQEQNVPEQNPHPQQKSSQYTQSKPSQSTTATQTDEDLVSPSPAPQVNKQPQAEDPAQLPQYGLRNTVDLGQKSPADPSLLDEEERNQRSMSAPPDNRVPHPNPAMGNMMGGSQAPPPQQNNHQDQHSNVRHIPIFVEGRDKPVINKTHPEPSVPAGEPHPQYASPPKYDREFFDRPDSGMGFHHGPNYARSFGTPFAKGFRQGHQPFAPQAAHQQAAAPHARSQSPKPQQQHYTQIPVHHEPPKQQQNQHPQQHFQQQQQQPHPQQPQQQQQPQRPQTPPPQQQQPPPPPSNDPIAKILNIQKEVLELMNQVENFVGKKTDKQYIYIDEMLTRNLIKLDDIETEGKENIRQARKEAIKCIQKCIAVLEAKAEGKIPTTPQPNSEVKPEFDVEMAQGEPENPTAEASKEGSEQNEAQPSNEVNSEATHDTKIAAPEEIKPPAEEVKSTPKKTKKVVKKRDKSKDKKEEDSKPADVEMKDNEAAPAETAQSMETNTAESSQ